MHRTITVVQYSNNVCQKLEIEYPKFRECNNVEVINN